MTYFLSALLVLASTSALSSSRPLHRGLGHPSRYFTQEQILPALPLVTPASTSFYSNSTILSPSSSLYTHNSYGDPIPCVYTNSPFTISNWLSENLATNDGGNILGFDVESVPQAPWRTPHWGAAVGPVTVQLATTDACLVVHLLRKTGRPSMAAVPILEAVLSDDTIIKAGVGIEEDMMELCQSWGRLEATSRLNLGGIVGPTVSKNNEETTGLKRLCKAILGVDLPKSRRLAEGDWGHVPLATREIAYCARDAWAGAAIANELRVRDPETFAPASLTHLLQHQESIDDRTAVAVERKRARSELTNLIEPFRATGQRPLPNQVRMQMSELQSTIKATAPSRPLLFDVSSLGIEIEQKSKNRNPQNATM
jgi:hypothetical protein